MSSATRSCASSGTCRATSPRPEIASELVVSTNTVRTHMRHIYAKLDAHTRSEAVARARELGLVAPGHARLTSSPAALSPLTAARAGREPRTRARCS